MDQVRATYERFRKKVEEVGGATQAAARLACSSAMVSSIMARRRRPGLDLAKKIEAIFDIPMGDWVKEPKLATVKRVID